MDRVKSIQHNNNILWYDSAYQVAAPVISCTTNVVTMTCATTGATIRYSTNAGSSWSTYSSSITISATTNYIAYATKADMLDSTRTSYTATYTPKLPKPTVSTRNVQSQSLDVDMYMTGYSGVTYYINYKAGSKPSNPTPSNYQKKVTGSGSNSTGTVYISVNYPRYVLVLATKSGYQNSDIVEIYRGQS